VHHHIIHFIHLQLSLQSKLNYFLPKHSDKIARYQASCSPGDIETPVQPGFETRHLFETKPASNSPWLSFSDKMVRRLFVVGVGGWEGLNDQENFSPSYKKQTPMKFRC
jgi:hypothetical protein